MFTFFFKNRGAISVFMSLILLPVLVFGCLIIDGTRVLGSKSIISGAGDLAMNGALSNYDTNLKDMYGLMGMKDVSSSELEQYFENTLNANTIDNSGLTGSYSNMIQLDMDSFSLTGVDHSQVCMPGVMTQQILEYAKFRAPLAFGEELLDRLDSLSKKTKTSKAVSGQMEVAELTGDLYDMCQELKQQLEEHNEWCRQKPTYSEIQAMEDQIMGDYRKVSAMLIIMDTIAYGHVEAEDGTTEEKVRGYLSALENTDFNTHSPENDFSSIMAALAYQQSITSSNLTEMVEGAESDEERERLSELKTEYERKALYIDQYRANVSNILNANVQEVYQILNEYYNVANRSISTAETAQDTLDDIISKLDGEIAQAMNDWKQSIDDMDEGEEKESLEDTYAKYEELFKQESLLDMNECLEENKIYFQKLKEYLSSFKFCDVVLRENSDPYSVYRSVLEGSGSTSYWYREENYENRRLLQKAEDFFQDQYSQGNYDDVNGMAYNNLNEHPYFQALKEMFESTNAQRADSKMDELNNTLDAESQGLAEILDLQDADWSGTIPSVWLSQSEGESATGSMDVDGMSDKNYKQMSASSREALREATGMLQRLSEALEQGLEALYIMEYAVQMFSYYTVDRDTDGNALSAEDITSLSGFQFSSESTALYKSEIEYIIWGNRTAKNNVEYTVLTLFGIRFLINSLFAFTNARIKSETASTAAFAGPAAPVVQVALTIALSVIESYKDIKELVNGKRVILLKNASTWTTWLTQFGTPNNNGNEFAKFSYKDYLRIFVLINEIPSTEKVLARMADCMQFNLRKASSSALDMTQSYTMIAVNADVTINTTFLDMIPRLQNLTAPENINQYQVHYKSVLAY